jgi:outer membrane cobalamin receptor
LKYLLLTLLVFCSVTVGVGQSVLDRKMTGDEKGKSLPAFLTELERIEAVRFYYLPDWIAGITIEEEYKELTVREVLQEIFRDTDLSFVMVGQHDVVILKDPSQSIERNAFIKAAARERKTIKKVRIGNLSDNRKGKRVVLRGKVINAESKDPLVGANVSVSDLKTGAVTDAAGNFEIKLPAGQHVLSVSFVNFEEEIIDLEIYTDGEQLLDLQEKATILDEIIISGLADRKVSTSNLGQTQLNMREVKRAPSLMGEVDLIKQIQVLPGVTTAGEAASGFNVRGGGVDQNLILYDGMPVFNSAHAFGFFSSFNSHAIRDVDFYRGGIPAEYGGRISSVLNIRSREGDYEKWGVNGGIGLISSNLMVGGPIKKDKTSIAASFRTTYSDWLINTIQTNYADLRQSTVVFYDGTFKLAHRFNPKTKITFSGYASRDEFRLKGDSSYQWSNRLGSVRLDHQFNTGMSFDLTIGAGSYSYKVTDRSQYNGFDLSYRITYPTAKAGFHLQKGMHKLTFGAEATYYAFDPGTLQPTTPESAVKPITMERQNSLESAFFFGDGISLSERFFVEAGARISSFTAYGPATINLYEPGKPIETYNQIDTVRVPAGQPIKTYYGVEPRFSMRYSLTPNLSIKAGYNRTYQYLHLVTNTTAIMPIDIWQPSGYYFKPQHADQISVGFFRDFKEKKYEAFMEGFYKNIDNILDFKDGANLILNPHLETDLLQGKGRAYGVEFSVAKLTGRLTGSVNYTYSRSFRTISGPTERESINQGKEYPSNFDQPNIVNIGWKYALSRRYFFTGNFTYHTGRPVTVPEAAFTIDHTPVATFSARNQYRIPDYHRLDVALVVEGNHKRKKFWDGTWTFSIYNLYGRKNPYTVFFKSTPDGVLKPYALSIIGTALPSISYNFKF